MVWSSRYWFGYASLTNQPKPLFVIANESLLKFESYHVGIAEKMSWFVLVFMKIGFWFGFGFSLSQTKTNDNQPTTKPMCRVLS
jgi:hypothetical protein